MYTFKCVHIIDVGIYTIQYAYIKTISIQCMICVPFIIHASTHQDAVINYGCQLDSNYWRSPLCVVSYFINTNSTNVHRCTHTRACMHTHTHTYMHIYSVRHIPTHTCTHTHTESQNYIITCMIY